MSGRNVNVQKLLEFVRNNQELVSTLYQKHFQEYGESQTLLKEIPEELILEFVKQLFGFNRQQYSDPILRSKLDTSLRDSLAAFLRQTEEEGREVCLEFEVVTELLKYCIQNNKAFTVQYKKRPQQQQQEQPVQPQQYPKEQEQEQAQTQQMENAQQSTEQARSNIPVDVPATSKELVPDSQTTLARPQVSQDSVSKTEALRRRLKIIFEFYCKQQQNVGTHATFDRISHECSVMNLGKFLMFCHGYGVTSEALNKYVLMDKFKKTSEGMKEIDAEGFFALFDSLVQVEQGLIERVNLESDKKFKDRLKVLNIPFATRDKAIVSHFPIAASQHKLTGHSGKTSDELMQYINERKRLKKQETRHISTPIPAIPLARIFKKRDQPNYSRSLNKYSQELSQSTNIQNTGSNNIQNKESGSVSHRQPQTQRILAKKNIYGRYEQQSGSTSVPEDLGVPPVTLLSSKNMNSSSVNVSHTDLKNLGLDKLIIMEEEDEEWLKEYKINSGKSQTKLGVAPAARPPLPAPPRNQSMLNDLRRRVVQMQESENLKERNQQAKLDLMGEQQKRKLESIRRK